MKLKEEIQTIEIYDKPVKPTENFPKIRIAEKTNIYDYLNDSERAEIDKTWKKLDKTFPGRLRNGAQASLIDSTGDVLSFQEADFKTYLAVSNYALSSEPIKKISENIRIACVGATVISADGYLALGYRNGQMTHVQNTYDATIAGLVLRDESGNLDLRRSLDEKLKREFGLGINDKRISSVKYTGLHSSRYADYSAMFTFVINVDMSTEEYLDQLSKTIKRKEFLLVHISSLPNLIERLFGANLEGYYPCLDGAMTLAKSLPHDKFLEVINRLRRCGKKIEFGSFIKGKFAPIK